MFCGDIFVGIEVDDFSAETAVYGGTLLTRSATVSDITNYKDGERQDDGDKNHAADCDSSALYFVVLV